MAPASVPALLLLPPPVIVNQTVTVAGPGPSSSPRAAQQQPSPRDAAKHREHPDARLGSGPGPLESRPLLNQSGAADRGSSDRPQTGSSRRHIPDESKSVPDDGDEEEEEEEADNRGCELRSRDQGDGPTTFTFPEPLTSREFLLEEVSFE